MKKYYLFEYIAKGEKLEVSQDDYLGSLNAKEVIDTGYDIEQLFGLAAKAYIELEECLSSAAIELIFTDWEQYGYRDYFERWTDWVNLRVLALLTNGSCYAEKLESVAKRSQMPGLSWENYDPVRRRVFDSSIYYRVMHGLRNYSIHDRLSIEGFSHESRLESPSGKFNSKEPRRVRLTCSPFINTGPLLKSDLRAATRDEIASLGVKGLDLKSFSRGYVEGLYELHSSYRELSEGAISSSKDILDGAVKNFVSNKGHPPKLLHLGSDPDDRGSAVYIDQSYGDHLMKKRSSWKNLASLRHRFISSEIIEREGVFHGNDPEIWIK